MKSHCKAGTITCKDCNVDITSDEFEMVILHNTIWFKLCDHTEDLLCHKCIEKRLGRPLEAKDLGYGHTIWDEPKDSIGHQVGCNITFAERHNLKY